jgi:hypothetical protein
MFVDPGIIFGGQQIEQRVHILNLLVGVGATLLHQINSQPLLLIRLVNRPPRTITLNTTTTKVAPPL